MPLTIPKRCTRCKVLRSHFTGDSTRCDLCSDPVERHARYEAMRSDPIDYEKWLQQKRDARKRKRAAFLASPEGQQRTAAVLAAAKTAEDRERDNYWRKFHATRPRACERCRQAFQPHHSSQLCCSRACAKALNNAKSLEWQRSHPEHVEARKRIERQTLNDRYIANKLGLPLSAVPPVLLEAKRAQLKILRLVKGNAP